jgi:hypothetical protein
MSGVRGVGGGKESDAAAPASKSEGRQREKETECFKLNILIHMRTAPFK